MSLATTLLKAPIRLYRATIKPWTGMECRHLPTCSAYALEAIDKNGAWKGFWQMVSRIARCHPWGTHGYDPVPDLSGVRHTFRPWLYGDWNGRSIRHGVDLEREKI